MKPNPNRCALCARKLVLSDFACAKCSTRFCSHHRLAEDHACGFDYKKEGRERLAAANERVVGDKIEGRV